MKIKDRKGSHVGVVLSFVIFITFVVFVYILVQPTVSLNNKGNLLENLEHRIILLSADNLTTASVSVVSGGSCVQLTDFFTITGMEDTVIVRDNYGNVLDADVSGNNLYVENNGNFFRVFESEEFDEPSGSLSGCDALTEGSSYFFGLVRTSEEIYVSRIIGIIGEYNNNYDVLKEDLDVGEGDEFGFSFTYSNGTTIMTEQRNVPLSISVFVKESQIQYININGARELGVLRTSIW